jgi:predicted  nucleic acid-binding Zn-ribbon protein
MIPLNDTLLLRPRHALPSAWTGLLPIAYWLVAEARASVLVELGSHHGASFLGFCEAVAHAGLGTRCHAVDTWTGDEHAGFYGEDVHACLKAIVDAEHAAHASLLRTTFDAARAHFADGSVDVLHIDGLHTYEAVRHDFETWLPTLSRRGVVLFHDTMVRERDFGVWRFWDEVSRRYPAFEFTHSHGLGVLAVGPEPPPAVAALCGLDEAGQVAVRRLFEALGTRIVESAREAERAERDAASIAASGARIASLEECIAGYAAHAASLEQSVEIWKAEALALRAELVDRDGSVEQVQALGAELDAARTEIDSARAAIGAAEARSGALADALAASEARTGSLTAALAASEVRIASLTAALEAERATRADMERRMLDADARARALETSTFWRMTAPLRSVASLLKRSPAAG